MYNNATGCLTVGLGNTLDFVLLFDCVAIVLVLRSVYDLVSEAFGNGLKTAERSKTSTSGHHVNGDVHPTQRRDIDGLSPRNTSGTDTCGIFTRTSVHDGVDVHLDRVLLCHDVDEVEAVLDDANSHQLLTSVAAVHHHGADKALDDRALSLAESLGGVAASGVGEPDSAFSLNWNVVLHRDVCDSDVVVTPFPEELRLLRVGAHCC
mmetsp:Transcript_16199/g.29129  ORF Transcript_16199/g.29129 Transcript_16199/m.29129 type:complete len:207 (-) Transcript_16199:37-657(-)